MLRRFRSLNNISVKWKMAIITSFSCAVALILAFEILIVYDLTIYQKQLGSDMSAMARLVGKNSAKVLAEHDAETAKQALAALRERREIVAAALYDVDGHLLARYVRGDTYEAKLPAKPKTHGSTFADGSLETFDTVRFDGKTLGYVYICCDTSSWTRRLAQYGSVVGSVLVGAVLLAFGVAWLLQRTISGPIVGLAHTMRRVSMQKNYTVRAEKPGNDEIGSLVDGFNAMLSEIQARDAALQMANDELEGRVHERTRELEQEINERKRAEDEVNARNKQLLTLHQISQMDLTGDSYRPGLQQIVEEISAATGFPVVAIEMLDGRKRNAAFRVGTGVSRQLQILFDTVPAESSLSGIVARSGSPLVEVAKEGTESSAVLREAGVKSFICMPMSGPEGVVGTLSLAHPKAVSPDGRLLRWIESLANYLASLIEQQRSHERLRESEEKTRKIIETALDAVVSINADMKITGWNGQAERIFGWTAEEALGKALTETIIPESFVDAHNAGVSRFLNTGETRVMNERIELTAKTKRGVEFPVELAISPIPAGESFTFTAFIRDITARKRYEAELAKARDAAVDGAKLKSEFLANMSHEIRTPMNGVIGMTDLLLDTTLSDEQKDYAQTIRNSAESLLTVINDILDFSKIEAGKMTIDFTEVNLRELLEETSDLLAPVAQEKGVEVYCDVDPLLPGIVKTDPVRIRQIVNNLMGNAVKFTERGEVVVACRKLTSSDKHVKVRLSVSDTGIGIPADRLKNIFESFTQVDGSTTRKFGGTGLGLAITRQLADLMGGAIGVESELQKGSTFWVDLDLERLDGDEVTPPDCSGTIALVADKSETSRRILREQLARCGCIVSEVSDTVELESSLQRGNRFDIAFVSQNLSDKGIDAVTKGLKDRNCFVALLTAVGDQRSKDDLRQRGVSAALLKPVRQSQIFLALRELRGLTGDAPSQAAETKEAMASEQVGLRVLLAEDNPVNRKVATNLLARLGHEVICAENGLQAVGFVKATHFDIVLMDVQMPDMDGLEATLAIRQLEATTGTRLPIIAMTAHVMKGDREKCLSAGMDDYVSKPITPDKIKKVLKRWGPMVSMNGDGNASESSVDDKYLTEISEGDATFAAELIEEFNLTMHTLLKEISEAYQATDSQALLRALHSLKGSAASVGASGLARACKATEEAIHSGDARRTTELVEEILLEAATSVDKLRQVNLEAA